MFFTNRENFISKIVWQCVKNNITLHFFSGERVIAKDEPENLGSAGYFDHEERILAVATKNQDWFLTLLHEYCHLEQFLESSVWFNEEESNKQDAIWDWLEGNDNIDPTQIFEGIKSVIECERDCEARAINYLKKNRFVGYLPGYYTQQANAYLSFYKIVLKERKWYTKLAPSEVKQACKLMPRKRLVTLEEALKPPDPFIEIIKKKCF